MNRAQRRKAKKLNKPKTFKIVKALTIEIENATKAAELRLMSFK